MKDSIYTSPELADTLLSLANLRAKPKVVADFACGEGSLLLAAERRWQNIVAIANDLSAEAISRVRRLRPTWELACANFLNPRSVRASTLRRYVGGVDLVAINPPFSRRDKRTFPVSVLGRPLHASVATAFVANSLPFLRTGGVLLAVLPDGCLVSLQDAEVWNALKRAFQVEVIRDNSHSAFKGVRARTSLVRMTKARTILSPSEVEDSGTESLVQVYRGKCQMHTRLQVNAMSGSPLVHTTHLRAGRVVHSDEYVVGQTYRGPALLFPRVGLVTPDKLCELPDSSEVVLSDCVLAVTCPSTASVRMLRELILASWPKFASSYRGTGAPYVTVERAVSTLSELLSVNSTKQPTRPTLEALA